MSENSACGGEDIDCRVVVLSGKFTREDNVSVENRAGFIGNRLIHIISCHQDGIEGGNRPLVRVSRPLKEAGEGSEDGWSISSTGWRFACCKANFTKSPCKTGNRVHHQEHFLPLIAEIFSNSRSHIGGIETELGRLVRGGHDQYRAGKPLFTEIVLDKFPYLTPPFSNERNHVDISFCITGHHPKKGRLTSTRCGENSHPLPFTRCEDTINTAHAHRDRLINNLPFEGIGRSIHDGEGLCDVERSLCIGVDRLSHPVEHPS
ncbi:MAG: hypothetical protein S4CHLAM102_04860 [Chlamydiia bacterium]|nr:hypothetical protein [Chlamydiia bacterium]